MPTQENPANVGHSKRFIPNREFAQYAGLTLRAARWVLRRAAAGKLWRGIRLDVRRVRGPGGEELQVCVASLPVELQAIVRDQQPGADMRRQAQEYAETISKDRPSADIASQYLASYSHEDLWADYDRKPEGEKNKALKNHEIRTFDESLAAAELTQRQRIDIVCKKFGVSAGTVYGLRKRCEGADPADWLPLLAPRHKGGQFRQEYTPAGRDLGQALWLTEQKRSIKSCHRELERVGKEQGWLIPSYSTYRRMLYELPLPLRVLMREGEKKLSERYPAHARLYSGVNPHDIWCADARITDTLILDEEGRPHRAVVVVIIDIRTRMVVGWARGKTESTELYLNALLNAINNTGALPREFYVDNSRAVASKIMSGGSTTRFRGTIRPDDPLGVLILLGIRIIFALPRWARSKPVESLNRTFSEMDRSTGKAYLGHRVGTRPEDHDASAAWSMKKYDALMEKTIAEYHLRGHRGDAMDGKSPLAVYQELIDKSPIRKPTPEQIALCLLCPERVKLDPRDNTIRLRGNRFWSPQLGDLPLNAHVVARFDPNDLSKPVRVYVEEKFYCMAGVVDKVGFRDQTAANTHLRARRQWEKAAKQQARAIHDMRAAEKWHTDSGSDESPDPIAAEAALVIFPKPKIAELVRPRQDLRGPQIEQNGISPSDIREAITRRYNSQK